MTGGAAGWGIDPSLMTPSYMAPYRPQAQGPNAYAAYSRPGFWGGVGHLINPFSQDPTWGNPVFHNQEALNSVGTKPFDAAASVGQRFIAPAIAMGVASRVLGPNTGSMMGDIIGMATGKGIAGSVGRGLGAAAGGAAEWALGVRGLGTLGGALGGAVGGLLGPMAVGIGVSRFADEAIFQPYLNTRRTAEGLRGAFSGVTFGDARGNPITGRGLGAYEAHKMASQITSQGISDMTFSSGEYASIAGMSMRSGLLDNVGASQIPSRVKDIANQVKMILSISKDPSVQSAIEELSKLRLAGASVAGGLGSTAMGAYRSIGLSASVAGASVQHVMNAAGAQGGLMYQMNGMTPYLGMMAAANVYGSFANAQRLGIIGDAHMARMGGLAGAMQSSLGGQISAMMTPFAQMAGMNRYVFGGGGGFGSGMNVSGVASAFGSGVAGNPLQAQGAMSLYGPMMGARMLKERGGLGTEDLAVAMLRGAGQRGLGAGGKFSAEQISTALSSMGLSQDQIQAFISQRAADSAPGALGAKIKAINASDTEGLMQYMSQNALWNTNLGKTVHGVKKFWNTAVEIASPLGRAPAAAAGAASDAITLGWNYLYHGSTLSGGEVNQLGLENAGFTRNSKGNLVSKSKGLNFKKAQSAAGLGGGGLMGMLESLPGSASAQLETIGNTINTILTNPSHKNYQDAVVLSSSGADSPEGAAALSRILKDSGMGGYATNERFVKRMRKALSKGNFTDEVSVEGGKVSGLDTVTGVHGDSAFDNWKIMGQAVGLLNEIDVHGNSADLLSLSGALSGAKYGALRSALGKDASDPAKALARLKTMARGTLAGGYSRQASISAQFSSVDDLVNSMPRELRVQYKKADAAGKRGIVDNYIAQLSGGSVSGKQVTMSDGASIEEMLGALNTVKESGNATKSAAEQATSNVDYTSFIAISKSMEGSAEMNLQAANLQLAAARLRINTPISNTQDGRPR